ncbi:MAG TPA: bifunctional riboflavin kinase/FAD synthetase [Beijerinckiaceae bacterium]|jgi:riboflavin kinase/FMN adenylyltransferase
MPPTDEPNEARAFAVCRDGESVPARLRGAVVAIGNFDGVHRGHRALIAAAVREGRARGAPAAVLTFEPHPRKFFAPDKPLFRLTPEPAKLAILEKLGLDGAFVRRFDAALAATPATDFAERLLGRELGVSGVVVGHDFRFGKGREGTPELLRELCWQSGWACVVVPPVAIAGEVVSSGAVRAALERGDVLGANALLGHRWFVDGEVRHGEKRGRILGFPTANLRLPAECGLRHGIYAVRAAVGGEVFGGVASFGRRPTFDDGAPLLEAFLFDFSGDLYGRTLAVEFVGRIRGEERFPSVAALVARMDEDVRAARAMLAGAGPELASLIG